ncbi:hypothetical protein NSK_004049 [Nannochloropsis salina CCMP1776]|uniref:HMG box domain-containing protein n=1 Tax=Nannochloropsis salina CCMP1776 TaxID=1027361 RepID=A0A4D9D0Z2_9STRA|nr:hypothetical protein NSK_004049 [Nannochloropsis salina CCMP1776]|eukprot:TFJ84584.1 hypothetical protein NSK_004049 [Nannochloropsis salina CCMP1776]
MEESQATSSDAIAIDDAANAPEMGKEEQDKRNTQEVQKSSERHGRHVEMKDTSNDQKGELTRAFDDKYQSTEVEMEEMRGENGDNCVVEDGPVPSPSPCRELAAENATPSPSCGVNDGDTYEKDIEEEREQQEEEEEEEENEGEVEEDPLMRADRILSAAKPVPAKSAWMLFTAEARELLKKEQPSLRVTEQVKIMSEQWKTLDDEARRPFLERAANDKERYQEEKLRWEGNQAAKAVPKGGKELRKDVEAGRRLADEMLFPLARIRKIMKLDPEVKTVSKEAALLVGKATELFLDMIGEESHKASGRRRTLKSDDVAVAMRRQGKFAFLRPDFPMGGKSNTGKEGGSGVSKRGERGNLEGKAEKMNAIAKLAAADKRRQEEREREISQEVEGKDNTEAESNQKRGRKAKNTRLLPATVVGQQKIANFLGHKHVLTDESSSTWRETN